MTLGCLRAAVLVAALVAVPGAAVPASGHAPTDDLHGGKGDGLAVVGHSDLGGAGLNGHVAVLGDYAYVGVGTNGGFAAQWHFRPKCDAVTNRVKVVSLADPANPTVVSMIELPGTTVARAVSAIEVRAAAGSTFTGDLLAVALEKCANVVNGLSGVQYYDVSDPARPLPMGFDSGITRAATRDVSLVQRPDGRVIALEANQTGGIRMVDASNPRAPLAMGTVGMDTFFSEFTQGCRPFGYAQGVAPNEAGSKAYAAYGDQGLLTLDVSGAAPARLTQTRHDPSEEGNSFRFVPNAGETTAVATAEDLLPARTTLTIASGSAAAVTEPGGSAPGVFRGCEAIWGGGAPEKGPLYRRTVPSLPNRQVVPVPGSGCEEANYTGLDVTGKLALVPRGCDFVDMARTAQAAGADAVVVSGGTHFSADPSAAADAGVRIPFVIITAAAGKAIRGAVTAGETVTGTLADTAETWGALRVLDLTGAVPEQTAVFNAPHTNVLTPGDGFYNAMNAVWAGDQALVAWMSDGLRVVDVSDRSAPKSGAFYVPAAVPDPTGHYGTVPLVVGVARFKARVVITDINSGLYVLEAATGRVGGGGGAVTTPPRGGAPVAPVPPRGGAPVPPSQPVLPSEVRRARDFRRCLAGVRRHTSRERRLARRGSALRRARARRHLKRHGSRLRARCVRRFGRRPGQVRSLRARRLSRTKIVLTFRAPGTHGRRPPAARRYLVKQSTRPIRGSRGFRRAFSLCKGSCRFNVTRIGTKVRLTVAGLRPGVTYYYSVAARDNMSGRLGPRSRVVRART